MKTVFLLLFLVAAAGAVRVTRLPTRTGADVRRAAAAAAPNVTSWLVRIVCPLAWDAVVRIDTAMTSATGGASACALSMVAQGTRETLLEASCDHAPTVAAGGSVNLTAVATQVRTASATGLPPACAVTVEQNQVVRLAPPTAPTLRWPFFANGSHGKRAVAAVTTQPIGLAGLWNLDRIDQRLLPLSGGYTYALDGAGTVIYHLDTGARLAHQEFTGRASLLIDVINDGTPYLVDCHGHDTRSLLFLLCFYSNSLGGRSPRLNGALLCAFLAKLGHVKRHCFAFSIGFVPACAPIA
jgi:hypothetical protein